MDTHGAAMAIEKVEPTTAIVTTGMSPVVAAVLARNPDAQTLREVLSLQREWEANEARKAYSAAIVNLKRDLPTVVKRDAKVDFTSAKGRTFYRHASLAGIMDAITAPLTQHGFSLTWKSGAGKDGVTVVCRLTHSEGHFEESPPITAPPDTSGSKSGPQAIASTITLLQRYSACGLLGIATADMEEPKGGTDDPSGDDVTQAEQSERPSSSMNLKYVTKLQQAGLAVTDAERHVGRKVKDWLAGDLEKINAWAKAKLAGVEPTDERDPGEDDDR